MVRTSILVLTGIILSLPTEATPGYGIDSVVALDNLNQRALGQAVKRCECAPPPGRNSARYSVSCSMTTSLSNRPWSTAIDLPSGDHEKQRMSPPLKFVIF